MKKRLLPLVLAALISPLFAVSEGDTYEQVIAEKGAPVNKLKMGQKMLLNYPNQTIKLQDGKVVEIKGMSEADSTMNVQPSAPAAPAGQWGTDYAAAQAQAKADGKLTFLFFTGSDWCGWCTRLDEEILSTATFREYAAQSLVLVKLDFPNAIPQSAQLKAQNARLAQMYGIRGYPTVIILNSAGKQVGTLGYQAGGPKPFINELKKLQ